PGEIVLLENVRFYAEEEQNNAEFAGYLAELGDLYVNDAFGTCHRAHASVDAITRLLPSYSGFLLQKEISMLTPLLSKPKRPFVVLLGGAKIRDKLPVIEKLLKRADAILIGGAMMFTFLAARKLLHSKKIILPLDVSTNKGIVSCDKMKKGMKGLDIGPETEEAYVAIVKEAKTVFWNGPMGLIEQKSFAHGTIAIAKALAKAKAITLIGGGDTLEIIEKLKLEKKYTHLSTGGGATLEFLSGKNLPGLAALDKKHPVRLQKKR
ncbi:phosphoglycerate kinase, partial [Candidatus Woesearchaeota archaeon]|nr:phosphoglycerate kinase [Candidatus Woesearchaeota archaeon]